MHTSRVHIGWADYNSIVIFQWSVPLTVLSHMHKPLRASVTFTCLIKLSLINSPSIYSLLSVSVIVRRHAILSELPVFHPHGWDKLSQWSHLLRDRYLFLMKHTFEGLAGSDSASIVRQRRSSHHTGVKASRQWTLKKARKYWKQLNFWHFTIFHTQISDDRQNREPK